MKMTFNKILILLPVFFATVVQCTAANRPDTANPYFEINRIMGTMAGASHISFNVAYYYEQSDTAGLMRDTISGIYKINGKKYYAKIDSTEIVQNDFYNVAVNKKDSVIIIGRTKTVFPAVMNTDILDPTLQSSYISGIVLSDSANTRKIRFLFKNMAPYSSYELVFDTVTYRMSHLSYKLKHYGIGAGNSAHYTLISVVFSNYQTNLFTDNVFDTSIYFTRQNGSFVSVPPYSAFEIINQVMNQ